MKSVFIWAFVTGVLNGLSLWLREKAEKEQRDASAPLPKRK